MKLIVLDFDRGDCFVYTNIDKNSDILELIKSGDFSIENYIVALGHSIDNCQWMFGDIDIHENLTPVDVENGQYS